MNHHTVKYNFISYEETCDHIYCEKCINIWLTNGEIIDEQGQRPCPKCREPFDKQAMFLAESKVIVTILNHFAYTG